MEKKMTFNYFYGTEAEQFSFYRIPKVLFTDSYFKDLSSDAKILYGLMLDRMSLSIKNQWFDDKNRAYIYFSIEDIMELLNCGRNKAIKSMRELDDETGIGLIEKRRQGFGKVNVIYVKTFMPEKTDEKKFGEELKKFKKQTSVENEESTEVYNSNFMKSHRRKHAAEKLGYRKVPVIIRVLSEDDSIFSMVDSNLHEVPKSNFKKFTFQTLIILILVILK